MTEATITSLAEYRAKKRERQANLNLVRAVLAVHLRRLKQKTKQQGEPK